MDIHVVKCIRNVFVKLQGFQPARFAVRTMAYTSYGRTKKKLPVNTVSENEWLSVYRWLIYFGPTLVHKHMISLKIFDVLDVFLI